MAEIISALLDHSHPNILRPRALQLNRFNNIQKAHPMLRPLFHHRLNVFLHIKTIIHLDNEHGVDYRITKLQL